MIKRIRDEFAGAELGDKRRSERLVELAAALAQAPSASFPEALGDGAALEAAYRFFGNEAVTVVGTIEPHVRESVARCRARRDVVVAHDTTEFAFPGARRGLGRLRGRDEQGFLCHLALAISLDECREPLGVVNLEPWTRTPAKRKRVHPRHRQREPDRESLRWRRGIDAVSARGIDAIHVMDREADAFELLAGLVGRRRFVVRACFDRRLTDDDLLLSDALEAAKTVVTRTVPLSARTRSELPRTRKTHPARADRLAKLALKAQQVELACPKGLVGQPKALPLNVVIVDEVKPPAGEAPVQWRLYTTEPIATAADIERVVDAYRCRWRVEEYFKALKSGCAIEQRQLETGHALLNALALFVPIAWQVLRLRTLAHHAADAPASEALTPLQLAVLRNHARCRLPRSPTVKDALEAIAALGGHLKRNGPPGWITLARGYERLLALEEGATLGAKLRAKCDQS